MSEKEISMTDNPATVITEEPTTDKKPFVLREGTSGNGITITFRISPAQLERLMRIYAMRGRKSRSAVIRLLLNLGIEAYEANPKFQKQLAQLSDKEQKAEAKRNNELRSEILGRLKGV
jgi:hypothetical protein